MLSWRSVLVVVTLVERLSAQEELTITPMFEEPVVVLEGQPLRLAFQTNLDIANGGGTRFSPDQQGQSSKAPDLYLEVGNNEWLPWIPDDQGFHTRPDN